MFEIRELKNVLLLVQVTVSKDGYNSKIQTSVANVTLGISVKGATLRNAVVAPFSELTV